MSNRSYLDLKEDEERLRIILKKLFEEGYDKLYRSSTKAEEYFSNLIKLKLIELSKRKNKQGELVDIQKFKLEDSNLTDYISSYRRNNFSEDGIPEKFRGRIVLNKIGNLLRFIYPLQSSLRADIKDKYAMCCGFDSYKDFKNKYDNGLIEKIEPKSGPSKVLEEVQSQDNIPDISTDLDAKAIKIRTFFDSDVYLYVFDQDSADERRKRDYHSNIDALVLENKNNSFNSFYLHNLGGKKEDYKDGILEWSDKQRKTFNINFKSHRRNLYMRFNCTNIGEGIPEILIGKFIFSLNSNRQIISGSIIISKEENTINKKPYNYSFKYQKDKTHSPPKEIQEYLRDKFYNFQKAPIGIFKYEELKKWLERKFGKNFTKQDIIEYDYLITYPISSFDEEKRENLFNSIESILLEGVKINTENNYKKKLINNLNNYLKGKYQKDRAKSRILIYPKDRDAGYDPKVEDNEKFNLEFIKYIRQSTTIIIIIPQTNYSRPSSVYTFAGFCMALGKKVFIFYEKKELLPVVFQKQCKSIGVYIIQYDDLNEIPFYINRELGLINT